MGVYMLKRSLSKKIIAILITSTVVGLLFRVLLFNFESSDYGFYLVDWMNKISSVDGFQRFGVDVGNYTCPYLYFLALISFIPLNKLYLIKIFSCAFDFILAIVSSYLTYEITNDKTKSAFTYVTIILCPTVIVNSAMWGQCDVIYVTFVLWSLLYLLKDKPCKSMLLFGLAFSIKLQSIFIAPLLLLLLISKKIKIRHLFIIPFTYVSTCAPAILAGRNPISTLTVYLTQGSSHKFLSANAPSLWGFTRDLDVNDSQIITIISIMLAGAAVLFLLLYSALKRKLSDDEMFDLACIFVIVIPFLLPRMHERYFYLSDILMIIYAFKYRKRWFVPVLTISSSLYCYLRYLYPTTVGLCPLVLGTIPMAISVVYLLFKFLGKNKTKSIEVI